jgi:hypothetical protein
MQMASSVMLVLKLHVPFQVSQTTVLQKEKITQGERILNGPNSNLAALESKKCNCVLN